MTGRPRLLSYVPVVVAVAVVLAVGPTSIERADARGGPDPTAERGRVLYEQACSSCHGLAGGGAATPDGEVRGPSLLDSGEAGVFYYLSTGRMPLANSQQAPVRKPPAFDDDEIEAIVTYVTGLGSVEPRIPDIDLESADLARGGELFRGSCAPCHNAAAAGGALSYGRAAPALQAATPVEIATAVRAGPGQMPVFGVDLVDHEDLDDIVRYVEYLDDPTDPGGFPLAHIGPIPEGFVAWTIGMVGLLLCAFWIGNRRGEEPG